MSGRWAAAGGGGSIPDRGFPTVFGRGLVGEIPAFVHRPYLVVTMPDLWPAFAPLLEDGLGGVHLVESLALADLASLVETLPRHEAVVGIGGGQALDVAKYIAWRGRRPLFQVPTATTVNAAFGQRAGLRDGDRVRYVGWAVPEAVYVDFDVLGAAPPGLNRTGVGDVLCYHTAHRDWELARDAGHEEPRWPFDAALVAEARGVMDAVLGALDAIREGTEAGLRTLVLAHRWGGQAFHAAGWNPRHIEGVDHFLFYNLERITGRKFIHGQPVGLGTVAGAWLQENDPDGIARALAAAGVDIRPSAMGITWNDVHAALVSLGTYVRSAGLWWSIADARAVTDGDVSSIRELVEAAYEGWEDAR